MISLLLLHFIIDSLFYITENALTALRYTPPNVICDASDYKINNKKTNYFDL